MDFNNMQTWHWFAIVGGGVLFLGIVTYFLPVGKIKVPAVITTAFGGLAAGLALGIVFMAGFGYKPVNPDGGRDGVPNEEGAQGKSKDPSKMYGGGMMGGGPGGPGMPKGMGKGGPGGGGFGAPSPRLQLLGLVNALDLVVDKPISVTLSTQDRAALAKELDGLADSGNIKDEDAKAKLDAIQKLLEKDRKALEAVGYRWVSPDGKGPGKGGFNFPKDSPNPFREGPGNDKLKALLDRLKK